jgi:hypothetical protein
MSAEIDRDPWALLGQAEALVQRADASLRGLMAGSEKVYAATVASGREIAIYRMVVAEGKRDEALTEVEKLRELLDDVRDRWPCPQGDDPSGCYCPGDGPCISHLFTP